MVLLIHRHHFLVLLRPPLIIRCPPMLALLSPQILRYLPVSPFSVLSLCSFSQTFFLFHAVCAVSRVAIQSVSSGAVSDTDSSLSLSLSSGSSALLSATGNSYVVASQSSSSDPSKRPASTVAFCLPIKDQYLDDIVEWVMYHLQVVKVDKFYLYDMHSIVPSRPRLVSLIQSGRVVYQYVANYDRNVYYSDQRFAYADCFKHYAKMYDFLGFVDADEFVVFRGKYVGWTLGEVLYQYHQYPGLVVIQYRFSSSGHLVRPTGGVLPNYWKCSKDDIFKSFCNTKYAIGVGPSVHDCTFPDPNTMSVDTNNTPTPAHRNRHPNTNFTPDDRAVIYHYVVKSRAEFRQKQKKGGGDRHTRPWRYFDLLEKVSTDNCTELVHYHFLTR